MGARRLLDMARRLLDMARRLLDMARRLLGRCRGVGRRGARCSMFMSMICEGYFSVLGKLWLGVHCLTFEREGGLKKQG